MSQRTIDQEIVNIVSGLPRSGTSMMMQILTAGGVPVVSDRVRGADEDNPKGYYEFEPVKKTRDDASWVPEARGKVVKMVYRLLYDLPSDHRYRVVFMERRLEEVIASQNIMLERRGQAAGITDDRTTMDLFQRQLKEVRAWLKERDNFEVLYVRHDELLSDPRSEVVRVRDFFDAELDVDAMADVVDPSLYRNRSR